MELLTGDLAIDDLDAFVERLGEIGDANGATIQAFDADYVAGRRHLERAVSLADRSIDRGTNVARERAVEILLYAAGRRQIDRALAMGVDEGAGEQPVVVLVDGGDEQGAREALRDEFGLESVAGELDGGDEEQLRAFFDVTDAELDATDASLEDLVCERVALLEVEK